MRKHLYLIKKQKIKSWLKFWLLTRDKLNYILSEIVEGTSFNLQNTVKKYFKIFNIFGNSEQNTTPSPSPENPQEITNVTGNVEVTISNENNTESQTLNVSLGNIELCKIGDYQDVLFKNTLNSEYYDSSLELNKWYKLARIRKLELNISDMDNSENYPGWRNVPNLRNDFPDASRGIQFYTTAYKCNITDLGIYLNINTLANNSILYLNKSFFDLTQTQWKTTYPNLVFELYYRITTPTYTLLNDTLQNQLDKTKELYTFDGTTNIYSDNEVPPYLQIQYYMKGE